MSHTQNHETKQPLVGEIYDKNKRKSVHEYTHESKAQRTIFDAALCIDKVGEDTKE